MYLSFFNLTGFPFTARFDINHLFLSETHSEALSAIVYGVLERKPFVVILGEVGLGKTAILKAALARLAAEPIHIVNVSYPLIAPDGITALLAEAAQLDHPEAFTTRDLNTVDDALLAKPGGRDHIVMIIDEAQAMPAETLEFIRLVSNLRAAQAGILQFILVGQPEFWDTLSRYEFRHLRQRIAIRRVMTSLSKADARRYIEFRLQLAGGTVQQTMTPRALKALIAAAAGVPRRINMIADNALLNGYAENLKPITHQMVHEAVKALGGEYKPRRKPRPWGLIAGLAAAAILLVVSFAVALKGGNTTVTTETAQLAPPQPAAPPPPPPVAVMKPTAMPAPTAKQPSASAPAPAPQIAATTAPVAVATMVAKPPTAPPPRAAASPPARIAAASPVVATPAISAPAETLPADSDLPPPATGATVDEPAIATDDTPPAPAETADAALPRQALSRVQTKYKVRFGETVYLLVRRFYGKLTERNVQDFLALNPSIKSPGKILEGSYVLVPSSRPVLDEKLGDKP